MHSPGCTAFGPQRTWWVPGWSCSCRPPTRRTFVYLRTFIRSGYRLEDAESHEIDRYGNAKYFVNNLVGIFERGQLVGAWGTQRDVTDRKLETSQEYRSRIHSSKSSSQ